MTAKLLDESRRTNFQVMVMPNLYGDILTDEAAQLQGGVRVQLAVLILVTNMLCLRLFMAQHHVWWLKEEAKYADQAA